MRATCAAIALALLACAGPSGTTATRPAVPEAPLAPEPEPEPEPEPDPTHEPEPSHEPEPVRLPIAADRAIDAAVATALARRQLPGCVIAIGRREGLVFLRAYGARAIDPEREPNDVDTIYDLASLTKPIATTTLVAILAERGALSLDDRVSRFLPAFATRGKEAVTVRHLLTHRSGLPSVDPLSDYDGLDRAASIARILALAPLSRPGRTRRYSDLGFVVLGELASSAAATPLDALVRREVLEPLGMRDSGYRPDPAQLPRIAPTERAERRGGVMVRGDVHDPRAHRLGGVSGHAGLFASAPDVARFARMMLGEGELEGTRVLAAESVARLVHEELGWDVRTEAEARSIGGMRAGAFGHLGYTGTSIRIDPSLDLFVIVLSNRVHPDGHGDARPLARAVERIAADAILGTLDAPRIDVRAGIDVERREGFPTLRDHRVVLLSHDAARARDGARTLDVLAAAPSVELLRVMAPEHGFGADREGHIDDARDALTGLVVHGLFGATRTPTDAMLEGADTLVIDLLDVGARFYTYGATLHRALEAAASRPGLRVVILDRPTPLGGAIVEGPALDAERATTFVSHHPLPLRHGLTVGELARLLDAELALGLGDRLVIVRAEGWSRETTALDAGARWTPPSPNLPDAETALLYPAMALLEGTDVSVGRGTGTPFHVIGAPWMDAARVLAELGSEIPGVRFEATRFTPRSARDAWSVCEGVRVELVDAATYRASRVGLALVRAVIASHPDRIDDARLLPLLGSQRVLTALRSGASLDVLDAMAADDARAFEARRAPFLAY